MNMTMLLVNGAQRERIAWLLPVVRIITALAILAMVGIRLQHDRYEPDESGAATTATLGEYENNVSHQGLRIVPNS